jgi:hypothetical protein
MIYYSNREYRVGDPQADLENDQRTVRICWLDMFPM